MKDINANKISIENKRSGQIETLKSLSRKKEEDKRLEIIEITNIKRSKIINENKLIKYSKNNWIRRLIIPYERSVMAVRQVKKETEIMFEELSNFVDNELKNKRGSLNETIKTIARKEGYYNNILYTIYCIAEGHVTKAYSGSLDYYNSDFSYDVFEVHLGRDLKYKVYDKATELTKNISYPDEETLNHFKLTKNGLPIRWWDRDGELRLGMDLRDQELDILNIMPVRNTKAWEIYRVKEEIIKVYLKIWETISDSFQMDLQWNKDKKKTLEKLRNGSYKNFVDYEHGNILSSLLKISENKVREIVPNMQKLNIKNERKNIEKYLPDQVIEDIDRNISEYKDSITKDNLKEIIEDVIKNDSRNWKLKTARILIESEDIKIEEFIKYREDEDFVKIAKQVIKGTDDEDLLLLSLYGIQIQENLNRKNRELIEKIIYPSNISKYKKIVKSKEVISLELLDKLIELKKPIRKKINLNIDKIKDSKEELNETINIISAYIDDSKEDENISILEEELVEETIVRENSTNKTDGEKEKFKYNDFLELMLDSGPINMEKGKSIAMENGTLLNAFISNVNQELYEYIEDQTIIMEEEFIKIDDFYIDIVKELVMSE